MREAGLSHEAHEREASTLTIGFAVLTLSDTRAPDTDTSGRTAASMIHAAGHRVVAQSLIADDRDTLRATVTRWLDDAAIDAIVTNGGTGISRRDNTIPVIESLLDSPLPGFGELFRALSFREIGAAAMLSRATAGIARGTFLIALPGSTPALELAMRALILPQVRHVVGQLRK